MKNKISTGIIVAVFLIGSFAQGATVLARYSFDDSTNLISDDSGNGHDLAVFSGFKAPAYSTEGKFGGASSFDGTTQGWVINNNIYPAGSFSFAAWVKPEGEIGMITMPWSLATGFNVYVAAGTYRFMTYYGKTLSSYKISKIAPAMGEWQHIAMTFEANGAPDGDGTYTGTMKGYVNGVLVVSMDGAKYDRTTSNDMAFGRRSTASFKGLMDEIYIYNGALTDEEIQALLVAPAAKSID